MGKISCEACNKKCKGQALKLPSDKFYHVQCFKCKDCNKLLSGEPFYSKNDSHYCKEDYQRRFMVRCGGCNAYIEGQIITALNVPYHPECFKCSYCGERITAGRRVALKDGMNVCDRCHNLKHASPQSNGRDGRTPASNGSKRDHQPLNGVGTQGVDPTKRSGQSHNGVDNLGLDGDKRTATPKKTLFNDSCLTVKNGDVMNGVHNNHFISSPESEYSMELRNLTESSIDEAVLSGVTTSTPANHHHHHHHPQDHHLHNNNDKSYAPYSSTSGYKSDIDASYIEADKSQRNLRGETMSCRCVSPESTFSRKSKDSASSEPMRKSSTLNFGPCLQGSYLEKSTIYKRSPSCNPPNRQTPPQHFHRPKDFSYRKSRTDIKKPGRKSGMRSTFPPTTNHTSITPSSPYVPQKDEEAIKMAKHPDGRELDEMELRGIERDDFPAPPDPAAVWPELLREHNIRCASRRSNMNGSVRGDEYDWDGDLEDVIVRKSRMEKDMKELSKMERSGAASLILKDMRSRCLELDPRSASRTPSAAREPPFKTRFTSPVFASPSRDLLMRSQLTHYDDFEPKYRTCATPMPTSTGHKIDYKKVSKRAHSNYHSQDLLSWRDLLLSQRPESTDGCLESSRDEAYSQYSSHSDYLDYDPITGLRSHRPSRLALEGRCTPISVLSTQLCFARDEPPTKTYPYEKLKLTAVDRPSHLDEEHLENYLSDDELEKVTGMDRMKFKHLPSWKQNDIKKRVCLFK